MKVVLIVDMNLLSLAVALTMMSAFSYGQTGWKCPSGNFKCANQKCIPRQWQCDSEDDCGDKSDEVGCDFKACLEGQFRCDSGRCIRSNWRCDGDFDCHDKSDEKGCDLKNTTCAPTQFTCEKSEKCIPLRWKCDHDNDCEDHSDEKNCKHSTCAGGSFTCKNKKCIMIRWKCDQDDDCGDGSDEDPLQCPARSCKSGQFTCNNRRCIKERWKCDGEDDCQDNSDEEASLCAKTPKHSCKQGEIPCNSSSSGPNGACILLSWRCDGEKDCHDGGDEEGCPVKPLCDSTKFNCSRGVCIDLAKKCDSKKDCPGGEDEMDCVHGCEKDEFSCQLSKQCIPENQVCDKNRNCDHDEDEPMSCNINECTDSNGHCSQICTDKKIGYACSCHAGFKLQADGRTCEDLNECEIHGSCSQLCENTKGTFKCSCLQTYILEPNQRSCKAIGQKPYLIFSERHYVRSYNIDGMQAIASGLEHVIGVSFDAAEEYVYWADTKERTIRSAALSMPDVTHVVTRLKNRSVPDALAVDWIGRKIYWTDSNLDLIEVAELDGSRSLVLVNTGLDEPRAVVVDPTENGRYIYWTDWGEHAKIEKMSMDGDLSTRTVLHSLNGSWPNGLSIDFTISRIFWTDAKLRVIESSRLDGGDRRIVLRLPNQHPFSISVFEDYMYWSDWTNEGINKANKFTGADRGPYIRNVYDVMGLAIYHPLRQPTAKNPCEPYNGGCSHLCLLASKYRYTCRCPTGVDLLYDGQTCNTTSAYLCTPTFCLNGGECINKTSRRYTIRRCICPDGFGGKRCEQRTHFPGRKTTSPLLPSSATSRLKDDGGDHEDLGTTIGMVVGVVLGIFLIAGICGYFCFRRLRKNLTKPVNFDNPVYRRTTEDSVPIMESSYDDNQL